MFSAFRRWIAQDRLIAPRQRKTRDKCRVRLGFEQFEARRMMAAGIVFDAAKGLVTINGSSGADDVRVAMVSNQVQVTLDTSKVDFSQMFDKGAVKAIKFNGGNGNDNFVNGTPIASTVNGGAGNDTLTGGSGKDKLAGGDGDDVLAGAGGNDTLRGNGGNDVLDGGEGNDALEGEAGNDRLIGGAGNDTYSFDADTALGGDTLDESGGGVDTLDFAATKSKAVTVQLGIAWEQEVNDNLWLLLNAEDTFENVKGGSLDDVIVGNLLANRLLGGTGNDLIWGHDGNDYLDGGEGNDDLSGGVGYDTMLGGQGGDTLIAGAYEADLVPGFGTGDQLQFMEEGVVRKFQVGPQGEIYSLHANNGLWMPMAGGVATWYETRDFFLTKEGALYRLGTDGSLQKRTSDSLVEVASKVVRFETTPSGRWIALDSQGRLLDSGSVVNEGVREFRLLTNDALYFLTWEGALWKNSAGVSSLMGAGITKYIVSDGRTCLALDRDGGLWEDGQKLRDQTKDFAIDSIGRLFMLSTSGELTRRSTSGTVSLGGGIVKLVTDASGTVFQLTAARELRYNSAVLESFVQDIAVDAQGRVHVLTTGGWLRRQATSGWDSAWNVVESGVRRMATSADGKVLYLNAANEVRAEGQVIWAGVKDFAIDSTGRVVLLGTNGVLEKQTSEGWEEVADQVQSIQISADGTSWTLIRQNARDTWEEVHYAGDGIRGIRNPSTKAIPASMTDCVGRVDATIDGQSSMGSGTLLATGANYIVLTAKHVVEGASRITFTTTQGVGLSFRSTTYSVARVILHPDPKVDLAILKLAVQVDRTIQGAALPSRNGGTPGIGEQLLIIGYGFNGDGVHGEQSGTSGSKRYGFSALDRKEEGLLQYRHDVGESGISRGDSGGPDLRTIKRTMLYGSDAGKVFNLPVIVGVHQDVKFQNGQVIKNADGTLETRYGDWARSVAITKTVETWIYDNDSPFN